MDYPEAGDVFQVDWRRPFFNTDTIRFTVKKETELDIDSVKIDMDSIKVSTYHRMKQKAWSILEQMPSYDETIKILNGKKIISFYKCINGDETDICIDGHARNIAYNDSP